MVRFGKYLVYHPFIQARGRAAKLVVKLFGNPVYGFGTSIYFRRVIKDLKFNRVLDVGCGNGEYAFFLAEKFPGITIDAIDVNEAKILFLQGVRDKSGIKNVHFFREDIT